MGNYHSHRVVARLIEAGADAHDPEGALDADPSEILVSDVIRLALRCGADPYALFSEAEAPAA